MHKNLIERTITKTQSKFEINIKERKDTTNQQSSYNLSTELYKTLKDLNLIEKKDIETQDDSETDYVLSNIASLRLGENIKKVVGKGFFGSPKVVFSYTISRDGTEKFQIKRVKNKNDEYAWFSLLYDNLIEGAVFSVDLDESKKELLFDVNFSNVVKKCCESLYKVDGLFNGFKADENSFDYSFKRKISYVQASESYIPKQKIYHGAPGTGKSYKITSIIEEEYPNYRSGGNENVFRITIFPDFSYYDFVGSVNPAVDSNKTVSYQFVPGPFVKALDQALNNGGKPVFLVLEEMSRGNIAAIFGDLFQLLDRKNGVSEYGIFNDIISSELGYIGAEIKLPNNFNILGSINTSDQNVYAIDTAFKRRFDYEYIPVDPISDLNNFKFKIENKIISWLKLYVALNEYILLTLKMSEDKQIGQFFILFDDETSLLEESDYRVFCEKLINYLWNDIHLASLDGNSIFKSQYKRYSNCLNDLIKGKNVFNLILDDLVFENEG